MGKLSKFIGYSASAVFIAGVLAIVWLSLPASGWRALSVQTGSMKPVINPGALVLVNRVAASKLAVGDVITYASLQNADTTITHRIMQIKPLGNGKNQYIVRGDANAESDAPVQESQIVGRVAHSVPHLGRAIDFVHSPLGLIIAIYIPAILIAAFEVKLLVQRLTRLELEKHMPSRSYEPHTMTIHPATSPVYGIRSLHRRPVPQHQQHRFHFFQVALVTGVAFASLAGYQTFSALTAPSVTLTGTSISTASAPPDDDEDDDNSQNTEVNNTTNIDINVNNPQTATTGDATSTGNTTAGNTGTGNANNSSSTDIDVTTPSQTTQPTATQRRQLP